MDMTTAHQQRLDTLRAGVMHHETFGITNQWGHERVSRDWVLSDDPYPLVEGIVKATDSAVVARRQEIVTLVNRDVKGMNAQLDSLARAGNINPRNFPPMPFWFYNSQSGTFVLLTLSGG